MAEKKTTIPHGVVELMVMKGYGLARAWREYLGLTQEEVAKRMGVTQASLSQMERSDNVLRSSTIAKLASALGIDPDQLRE